MRKKVYARISRVLVLLLVAAMLPVYSFGAAGSLNSQIYNDFHMGQNYNVKLKIGKMPMYCCIECDDESDYDDDDDYDDDYDSDLPYIKSIKNSKPSVVKVCNFEGDGTDFYTELKGLKKGNAKITLKFSNGQQSILNVTVVAGSVGKSSVKAKKTIYKNTKKVKVVAKNVLKGDKIKLKIGKKTYTKKIKEAADSKTVTFKIKKPGFYGKKYTLSLVRKKKTIAKSRKYVYLSDTVYVGYTKKKVKWLKYWNDPDKKNKSSYSEQWVYYWGDETAYLYFNNKGVVTNWQIYENY